MKRYGIEYVRDHARHLCEEEALEAYQRAAGYPSSRAWLYGAPALIAALLWAMTYRQAIHHGTVPLYMVLLVALAGLSVLGFVYGAVKGREHAELVRLHALTALCQLKG